MICAAVIADMLHRLWPGIESSLSHIQAHASSLGSQLHALEGQVRGPDAYHVGQLSSAGDAWEVGGIPCTEQAFYRADLQQWQSWGWHQ